MAYHFNHAMNLVILAIGAGGVALNIFGITKYGFDFGWGVFVIGLIFSSFGTLFVLGSVCINRNPK